MLNLLCAVVVAGLALSHEWCVECSWPEFPAANNSTFQSVGADLVESIKIESPCRAKNLVAFRRSIGDADHESKIAVVAILQNGASKSSIAECMLLVRKGDTPATIAALSCNSSGDYGFEYFGFIDGIDVYTPIEVKIDGGVASVIEGFDIEVKRHDVGWAHVRWSSHIHLKPQPRAALKEAAFFRCIGVALDKPKVSYQRSQAKPGKDGSIYRPISAGLSSARGNILRGKITVIRLVRFLSGVAVIGIAFALGVFGFLRVVVCVPSGLGLLALAGIVFWIGGPVLIGGG